MNFHPDSQSLKESHPQPIQSKGEKFGTERLLNYGLVQEIVDYILVHNGPDTDGKGHATKRILPIRELEAAIEIALARGLNPAVRPYHFRCTLGVWKDQLYIDELLCKKMDQLVEKKFNGDFFSLLTQVTQKILNAPLTEDIGGRQVTTSFKSVAMFYSNSPYHLVCRYLEIAGHKNTYSEFKPWHMACSPMGTFDDQATGDKLLTHKLDQVLREQFSGDVFALLTQIRQVDLVAPFKDTLGGRPVAVSMKSVTERYFNSPYKMVCRYLELTGLSERYSEFQPWHMAVTFRGALEDPTVRDALLKRKIEHLRDEKFGGDLFSLITGAVIHDLRAPFSEILGGREVIVSAGSLAKAFDNSPYNMLCSYLEITGQKERYREFQPWHLAHVSNGTYKDPSIRDSLLKLKIDQILKEQFDGDLVFLLTQVTLYQLKTHFTDTLADRSVAISMAAVAESLENSAYNMLCRYLEITGLKDSYSDFQPWHMTAPSLEKYEDPLVRDALLTKKIGQLLENRFDGDLFRLVTQVTISDLTSPLIESLGGRQVVISMTTVGKYFCSSTYTMLKHYLEISGADDCFPEFQPWHLACAPMATFENQNTRDTLITKKIEQLLSDQFNNDWESLLAKIRLGDLMSPFNDMLGGRQVPVSMGALINTSFDASPYQVLKRYAALIKTPFPFSPLCFVGSSECRMRRIRGELSDSDLRKVLAPDGKFDTTIFGFSAFKSQDKHAIRELMIEAAEVELEDRAISYLGLETEQFASIRAIHQRLNLNASQSLVVEADPRVFSAMNSVRGREKSGAGNMLREIQLTKGKLESVLEEAHGSFNFVNFDYLGHMSPGKEYALQLLFERKLLAERALIFITLQDNARAQGRAERAGYSRNQDASVSEIIERLGDLARRRVTRLGEVSYKGGTQNERHGSMMLFIAYRVE